MKIFGGGSVTAAMNDGGSVVRISRREGRQKVQGVTAKLNELESMLGTHRRCRTTMTGGGRRWPEMKATVEPVLR